MDREHIYKRLTQILTIISVALLMIIVGLYSNIISMKTVFEYYNNALFDSYKAYYEVCNELATTKLSIENTSNNNVISTIKTDDSEPIVETIYDIYSEKDLEYLYRMVETETFGADVINKSYVAKVALNRVNDDRFPNTLKEVIQQENQFVYYRTNISENTKLACEIAFSDINNDALWFQKCKTIPSYAEEYLYTDEVGHSFFK